jgi:hypothetical protein
MPKRLLQLSIAGTAASLAAMTGAHAQSADALLDKLVEKGILTDSEAKDLRDEADKGFTTAYQVKSGMPDWVTALKIGGDFRGRVEGFYAEPDVQYIDRTRFRYRLRLGVVANLKDDFEVGLRLASGDIDNAAGTSSGTDPISTNQTFQNNGSKKGIFIDQAYARWSPLHANGWTGNLAFGKIENPFVFSDMVFDGDYTPEGGAIQLAYALNDVHSLKFNTGLFAVDEIGADSDDPFFAGAQIRWDATWNKHLATSAGVAALGLANEQGLGNAAVPNINRGNTRTAGGALVNNYNPIVADASVTWTLESVPAALFYTGPFPIRLAADYMVNPAIDDRNEAYSIGIMFGKSGKKKTWDVSYTYKYLEGDAWYEEMVDSDFGGFYQTAPAGGATGYQSGTNVKGHIARAAYSPTDSLTLSLKWFFTELIDPNPVDSDSSIQRMQVDALWKF